MSLTVSRSDIFPVGTSVGAYPRSARHLSAPPSGSAVESHTVAADGTCGPFAELTTDQPYTLYASVSSEARYLDVSDSAFSAPPTNLTERIDAHRESLGIS